MTGGCACGAVRFIVNGPPRDIGECHCRRCQRAVGAASVTWATIEVERVEILGAPAWWRSSAVAQRGFCPACGTSLFLRADGDWIDVTVAAFDEPVRLAPRYHIWTASRQPWVALDPCLPAYRDGGPDGDLLGGS